MKIAALVQVVVVTGGLVTGWHFSKMSSALHQEHASANGAGHAHRLPAAMDHGTLEVGGEGVVPQLLGVEVDKDPMSGWNIRIRTRDFEFDPQGASRGHRVGRGHAHVNVDGVKVARVYGPWFHLPARPEPFVVEAVLTSNTHAVLTVGGKQLSQQVRVGR